MKKRYRYNYSHLVKDEAGNWSRQTEVLEKTITDRVEPRDAFKKAEAAMYFTAVIRERYGDPFCVHSKNIEEIGG